MTQVMINWRLGEIMARHDIKGLDLAEKLDISPKAVSHLRRSKTMPRINGEALERLCVALSDLSGKRITPSNLIEYEIAEDVVRSA